MEISKLFGLPAHPLLVHIPIVLLPLVGVGAIAMAVSATVRDRIGWIVVALSAAALVGVQLAMGSGEQLQDSVDRSTALREHIDMAEQLRPIAFLFFVAVLVLMLLHRHARGAGQGRDASTVPSWVQPGVAVVCVVLALTANFQLVRVGHNGARATWEKVKISSTKGDDGG